MTLPTESYVLYLASDESKFVSGGELIIDGGYTSDGAYTADGGYTAR
jgi:hypothetical protein